MSSAISRQQVFETSKSILSTRKFDVAFSSPSEFHAAVTQQWFGRVWADLTGVFPFSTGAAGNPSYHDASARETKPSKRGRKPSTNHTRPTSLIDSSMSLETALQTVFIKYALREFQEGVFLIRAEFGADWFTPILQHPHCVLRHLESPLLFPSRAAGGSETTVTRNATDLEGTTRHTESRAGMGHGMAFAPPDDAQKDEADKRKADALAAAALELGKPPLAKRRRGSATGGFTAESNALPTTTQPHSFESFVVFYLGNNHAEFCHAFCGLGLISGINTWSAATPPPLLYMDPNPSLPLRSHPEPTHHHHQEHNDFITDAVGEEDRPHNGDETGAGISEEEVASVLMSVRYRDARGIGGGLALAGGMGW
ncbi:hypothetical protein HK104_009737 [Borealophlyctis nickersoniae]|nr:hypothetical protein HK104_009737 [Borealophlyctis nickersoniae]